MLQRLVVPFASWIRTREIFLAVFPAALAVIVAFVIAMQFVKPAPPRSIVMTTGGETGAYFAFGNRYREILKESGVDLQVKTSAGSIENIKRLGDPAAGFHVGLLQGGIGSTKDTPEIISIGRVFHEPLWVFYRGAAIERLSQLAGRRIAVGPEGSGTRPLALAMLGANKVSEGTATLLPATGAAAVEALRKGEVDAVFLVQAPEAPLVQQLLRAEDVKLLSFPQAEAYTKLFPYLARVVLPQGVIDLVGNLPARDIELVAPTAALVVRDDTHPAIVSLLAEAAQEVHGRAGLFNKAGEFPTAHDPAFEMSADAQRYYKQGAGGLRRVLPFWLANFVERMAIMLVPALTVLLPLVKVVPWLYRWRIRQRLFYWYRQLRQLEERVVSVTGGESVAKLKLELDEIDQSVSLVPAPIEFAEQFYNLRSHVELVRQRLGPRAAA